MDNVTLINPILGLDPFILVEFREEDGEIRMTVQSACIPDDELVQALRDIADLLEEQSYVDQ